MIEHGEIAALPRLETALRDARRAHLAAIRRRHVEEAAARAAELVRLWSVLRRQWRRATRKRPLLAFAGPPCAK
jgi:hypothetical protein